VTTLTELQPFPVVFGSKARFHSPEIDEVPPSAADVDSDLEPEFGPPWIDLSRLTRWSAFSIQAEFEADLSAYCSKSEAKKVEAYLVLTCSATKIRRAQQMTLDGQGKWKGALDLHRAEILDTASLCIRLMPRESLKTLAGESVFAGALIAETDWLNVYLDERAKPYAGPIKWKWENFSTSETAALRDKPSTMYYVYPSDVPTVFLNSGLTNFKNVLEGSERAGPTTSIRHSLELGIATSVYMQLLINAFLFFKKDEETGQFELDSSWRGSIVRAASKPLFGVPAEDALARFHDSFEDEATRGEVLSRLMSVSQQFAKVDRGLGLAVRASELYSARGDRE
jgi:hypothetical protein